MSLKIQVYKKNIIITTTNKLIAVVLTKTCSTINITDNNEEYHCQASVLEYKE